MHPFFDINTSYVKLDFYPILRLLGVKLTALNLTVYLCLHVFTSATSSLRNVRCNQKSQITFRNASRKDIAIFAIPKLVKV